MPLILDQLSEKIRSMRVTDESLHREYGYLPLLIHDPQPQISHRIIGWLRPDIAGELLAWPDYFRQGKGWWLYDHTKLTSNDASILFQEICILLQTKYFPTVEPIGKPIDVMVHDLCLGSVDASQAPFLGFEFPLVMLCWVRYANSEETQLRDVFMNRQVTPNGDYLSIPIQEVVRNIKSVAKVINRSCSRFGVTGGVATHELMFILKRVLPYGVMRARVQLYSLELDDDFSDTDHEDTILPYTPAQLIMATKQQRVQNESLLPTLRLLEEYHCVKRLPNDIWVSQVS